MRSNGKKVEASPKTNIVLGLPESSGKVDVRMGGIGEAGFGMDSGKKHHIAGRKQSEHALIPRYRVSAVHSRQENGMRRQS